MAIDAASYDSTAATRPVVARDREATPSISRDSEAVEVPGELSFGDLLDAINPLQHIPIIGTLYRNLTGDTLNPAARVMGGILYGGVIGGLASVTNAVIEQSSGKDVGDHVMASLGFGEGDHPATPVAVAAATGGAASASTTAPPVASPVASSSGSVATAPQSGPAAAALPQAPVPQAGPQMAATTPSAAALQKAVADANGGAGGGAGGPTRLSAAGPGPSLIGNLSGGNLSGGTTPTPSKMPARDTPLASSTLAKHSTPKFAAPMTGSTMVNAQTAGTAANGNAAPAAPEALSETMMRNLAKYEQSRKAAQPAAPALRVSG